MVTTILFGIVFSLSLILSGIYGYYLGVRNTMDYYALLLKRPSKNVNKALEKFDSETDDTISSTKTYN